MPYLCSSELLAPLADERGPGRQHDGGEAPRAPLRGRPRAASRRLAGTPVAREGLDATGLGCPNRKAADFLRPRGRPLRARAAAGQGVPVGHRVEGRALGEGRGGRPHRPPVAAALLGLRRPLPQRRATASRAPDRSSQKESPPLALLPRGMHDPRPKAGADRGPPVRRREPRGRREDAPPSLGERGPGRQRHQGEARGVAAQGQDRQAAGLLPPPGGAQHARKLVPEPQAACLGLHLALPAGKARAVRQVRHPDRQGAGEPCRPRGRNPTPDHGPGAECHGQGDPPAPEGAPAPGVLLGAEGLAEEQALPDPALGMAAPERHGGRPSSRPLEGLAPADGLPVLPAALRQRP